MYGSKGWWLFWVGLLCSIVSSTVYGPAARTSSGHSRHMWRKCVQRHSRLSALPAARAPCVAPLSRVSKGDVELLGPSQGPPTSWVDNAILQTLSTRANTEQHLHTELGGGTNQKCWTCWNLCSKCWACARNPCKSVGFTQLRFLDKCIVWEVGHNRICQFWQYPIYSCQTTTRHPKAKCLRSRCLRCFWSTGLLRGITADCSQVDPTDSTGLRRSACDWHSHHTED